MSTLYTQLTKKKKADPHLTRMILLNMFQIFQINKINFEHYLKLHKHPDTFIQKCNATTQTEYITIRPELDQSWNRVLFAKHSDTTLQLLGKSLSYDFTTVHNEQHSHSGFNLILI